MIAEIQCYLSFLDRRIALLQSLAESLAAAQSGLVAFDLSLVESQTAEQARLCCEINKLGTESISFSMQCTVQNKNIFSPGEPPTNSEMEQIRETQEKLATVEKSVKHWNDTIQVLMQRTRRTVNALLYSYHTFSPTYSNPSAPPVLEERF